MFKIFAAFTVGMLGASAAPLFDIAPAPFDRSTPLVLVLANGDGETQTQSTNTGSQAVSKPASSKQRAVRRAPELATDDGFCECPDERGRAHCLIYLKLRGDRW